MYMNTRWELRVALILIVILVSISLGGCSVPQIREQILESNTHSDTEAQEQPGGITNFQGIADALGCVFAPDKCNK